LGEVAVGSSLATQLEEHLGVVQVGCPDLASSANCSVKTASQEEGGRVGCCDVGSLE
jgi:hypothetical protein